MKSENFKKQIWKIKIKVKNEKKNINDFLFCFLFCLLKMKKAIKNEKRWTKKIK
mgnify:CR=1 FL=1